MSEEFNPAWETSVDEDEVALVEFKLNADLKLVTGDYPFIVEVTTSSEGADDVILFDAEKTFVFSVVCGGASFIVPPIGVDRTHEIDDTNPVLRIPIYVSYAPEICEIGQYELYSDATTVAEAFDPAWVLNEAESVVEFTMTDEWKNRKLDFPYIVRVSDITNSDEVIFDLGSVNHLTLFCGVKSCSIPSI